MLVHQNADAAATAQQLDRFSETFAALKDFQTKLAARLPNVPIDVWITDALVNGRSALPVREMREQSRAKLPGTNMAQEQHERLLLPETMFDVFKVFQAHPLENFFRRHAGELHAAEQVRSQLFKMRSEEHTSELQSLTNLVCRLLLEKKKTEDTQPRAPKETSELPNTRLSDFPLGQLQRCPRASSNAIALSYTVSTPEYTRPTKLGDV